MKSSNRLHFRLIPTLAFLWPLYYFLIFTIGRDLQYTQLIIWGGLVVPAALTIMLFLRKNPPLPPEAILLVGFVCWSLSGFMFINNQTIYLNYLRLMIQYAVLLIFVSTVIRISGGFRWFFWAMVGVGLYNAIFIQTDSGRFNIDILQEMHREGGVQGSANSLGIYMQLGILGALGLLGERRSWFIRGFLIATIFICLYGLVASAARGSFLAVLLYATLWPLMCMKDQFRHRWLLLLPLLLVAAGLYIIVPWILDNTFLGQRLIMSRDFEDNSSQVRLELILIGLRLGIEHPVFGVGLGQFGIASGTGYYAHNEWAELLATTGFIGFLLYMAIYWFAWRRLTRISSRTSDSFIRYWCSISRMVLLVLVFSGMTNRPNFLSVDAMFLISIVVGIGMWAQMMHNSQQAAARLAKSEILRVTDLVPIR